MTIGQRVCVVGAGVSGLVAIRELVAAGHEVQAYEKSDDVVGVWNHVYDSVQLLTSRTATSFKGFPMPRDYPQFPDGEQYRRYIRAFADWAGLRQHVRFGVEVRRATPVHGGRAGWMVDLDDGTSEHFDALVAAHGHLWAPRVPRHEGEFTGAQVHTAHYRGPADLVGETVLVVGSGNSACDIVTDAIATGRRPLMSVRTPTWFVPQSFYGTPRGDLSFFAGMPAGDGDDLAHLLVKASVGRPSSYGFPEPADEDWTARPPTFSTLVPYWALRGRVSAVPEIARFDGQQVTFTDGSTRLVDTLVWATGYHAPVPFLADGVLSTIDGVPARIVSGLVSADADNFYYSGMCSPRGGAPHNYGRGAETLARLVTARAATGVPLGETLFADQEATGRMDWLLAHWVAELDAADARLADATRKARAAR